MNKAELCVMCGRVTANKGRVCIQCIEALDDTFEENINNEIKKISHDKQNRKTNREM